MSPIWDFMCLTSIKIITRIDDSGIAQWKSFWHQRKYCEYCISYEYEITYKGCVLCKAHGNLNQFVAPGTKC